MPKTAIAYWFWFLGALPFVGAGRGNTVYRDGQFIDDHSFYGTFIGFASASILAVILLVITLLLRWIYRKVR